MIKNVLFDLDGTLTDSRRGITGCFHHTVQELSGLRYSDDEIMSYVGVPLRKILEKLLRTEEEEKIEQAVAVYRDKYAEIGITGNVLFPGVRESLRELSDKGCQLFVVTMKNREDAGRVTDYLGIRTFFSGIYGPGLDGIPDRKVRLIEAALAENTLNPEETVMVGDRAEDITSGKQAGTFTIGVTWGFGERQELIEAEPDRFCESANELPVLIERLF